MHHQPPRDGRKAIPGVFVVWLAVWLVGAAASCTRATPPVPLTPAFDSPEGAARAVLDALWTRDTARLRSLPITETEFRKHVWPALPVAQANVGATPDYTWAEMTQKNAAFLSGLLADHGGRRFVLRNVRFLGEVTDYDGFTTHGKAELTVDVDGRTETIRLFGSMIESSGRWKIYSYVVD